MGKDLRIFTTPFKDELISSFLQRNSELRGVIRMINIK